MVGTDGAAPLAAGFPRKSDITVCSVGKKGVSEAGWNVGPSLLITSLSSIVWPVKGKNVSLFVFSHETPGRNLIGEVIDELVS